MKNQHILYGARTGNCLRAAVALEEAGLPYTIERIALRQGEHKSIGFLKINPQGLIPALAITDEDGGRTILTESNAIMFYAAGVMNESDLLGDDIQSKAVILERFFYFLTEVISPSIAGFRLDGIGLLEGVLYFDKKIVAGLSFADEFVRAHEFMAGDSFSLADIAAYTITAAHKNKLDWNGLPNLEIWFNKVAARPAVQRGMSKFG